MDKNLVKGYIAKRAAKEFKDGDVVNLGIGLPTLIPNYLPEGVNVILQAENGTVGACAAPNPPDPYINNAGGQPSGVLLGGSFIDSTTSFALIRGGHVDATVLGALEVDEKGNLSNWIVPGKMVPGMGGAMDLVVGAKKVIVAMEHTQKGTHKILKQCQLPYTAVGVVKLIITEMGVIEVTPQGLLLTEINPEFSVEDVQAATGAPLTVSPGLKSMEA